MEIILGAVIVILFVLFLYNNKRIDDLESDLRRHLSDHIYKKVAGLDIESVVNEVKASKAKVFSPVADPMSEFNGKRDDWYGDEDAR